MKHKEKRIQENKGITLIALVVTIVVLIILATVSINAVFGDNGIIKKAERAKEVQENAGKRESDSLDNMVDYIDGYKNGGDGKVTLPDGWNGD